MRDKSALEVVEVGSPGFSSRLFLVKKGDGVGGPVFDLSPLNLFPRLPSSRWNPHSPRGIPSEWAALGLHRPEG